MTKTTIEMLREYREQHPRPLSPCIDQTGADVAAYYRGAAVGAPAVVRQTQYGRLQYHVTEVEGGNPRSGRIYIKGHGAFYAKSGKNCFHPTGQTSLVVPTAEVLAWAAAHPQGEYDIQCWKDTKGGIV